MNLNNRYDFVLLFDVKDGNPNGDPDAGNLPRLDAETGHGLMTDVAVKRKVRNFVALTHDQTESAPQPGEKRHEIYVREKAILNLQHQRAYSALKLDAPAEEASPEGSDAEGKKGKKEKRKGSASDVDQARKWMCQNFFDVRTFGAVMSTGINCGQVRGPVQLTFARSIDPIVALEHSITRMAVATEAEAEKQQGDNRTMGRKHTVPYGIYMAHGFVSSFLAKQTGFGEDDLELLWQALENMFEHDRSAARGEMSTRGLYVFKHASELGNAHAHALFDRVSVRRKPDVDVARNFSDYEVNIDETGLPAGITLIRRVG
ncbi:MAG: type I-C CRISPR-associated protein Cas7/Csd2 [Gammaproteobacteria bacterium]|jgi:CRISPR-associated protein Csd2|nr:type I-C CRISPR-associated protein Cas7/Csd2 [Gammaproteobacteria bacterium]MBU0771228.1 type I-C CRISPR-associated protein Cas7/Csd2 [Gammaproteobacteria bacterium]MBU0856484.1 type I-C CRISPR-associated protein Cas7/Csd2 [Gammaproteobacteria bacterium]MBU1847441.1 type I-C CRISPR-associated protein Cas7/Csd2 [Gammaproteobacteria bacterium]